MKAYLTDSGQVLKELGSAADGIREEEAQARLSKYGKNKLAEGKKTSLIARFLKQLADPMTIILIVAAAVSGVTAVYSGESFTDVIIILAVVLINAVLGVVQESKAEKAIEALQEIAAATCKVMRGGQMKVIHSEDLVPGDIVLLEAGDAVPADARILESASLQIEEAALTGESVPVQKISDALALGDAKDVPLGDRRNMAYMGSTVVYGRGRVVVTDTGMRTQMGKIADALSQAEDTQTPLQRKLGQLSKILSVLVLVICAIVFAINVFRLFPNVTGQGLLDTFMIAVSLAVAAIPEGLSAVVTIVLSIGVTNMSKRNAIIRKLTAVETLGCTQVICSDKTGTLTQNKMTVVDHFGADETLLATAMALCTDAQEGEDGQAVGEPTECALVNYLTSLGRSKKAIEGSQPRVGEAPFDSMRKMMSTVHKLPDGGFVQYTKGAPDMVLDRCARAWENGREVPMTEEKRRAILADNKRMAGKALRVLCAAVRHYDAMPQDCSADALEKDLCFVGLTGMIDPVRPEVLAAIDRCRHAGIRPVMITGDHRDTAAAIALELGIIQNESQAVTGAQIDDWSDEELLSRIENIGVYARVQPEHKVRIVKAWQQKGMITAMTGDGVNDAPSIKNADIGIGMGITGTDVTKNVADMVLADDNFATIVSAVEEGRRIYDNIRKAVQFLLASNLAEVLAIFTSAMLGFTILEPAHLLWINLVTDCFPALALGMEKAESDVMNRPPRDAKEGIFAGGMAFDIALQGALTTLLTLAAYFIGHYIEAGAWEITTSPDGMTMAFLTLSMTEVFHSFNMRARRASLFGMRGQNKWLWGAGILSLILTAGVIFVPPLAAAFGFAPISFTEYAIAMALAASIIPLVEIIKAIQRKCGK